MIIESESHLATAIRLATSADLTVTITITTNDKQFRDVENVYYAKLGGWQIDHNMMRLDWSRT